MTLLRFFFLLVPVLAGALRAVPDPVLSRQPVNPGAPYPECHASTIVELSRGGLAAAWFGGTKERHPDVGIWFARHEEGRWQPAVEVANGAGAGPGGSRLPTWNPVLFQAPGGDLLLFYKVGPSPSTWWGMVRRSSDGGRSWAPPRRLPEGILGPVKNKPVVLPDGSWLAGSSTEGNPDGWRVHFERSADAGATWSRIGPVAKGSPPLDLIQPSLLQLADGSLEAVGRTRNGVIGATFSSDGGRTWTPLASTGLPNPNSGTDAVTLRDGRHLLVYNHSAPPPERPTKGVRWPLDVALSSDGRTWRRVLTLESEPLGNGYAYPAVIQAADGRVHVTYTWDRRHIRHVVLDPALLP